MDAHFDSYFDVFLSKATGCHNSPQKRPPELIFGAKFTARRAESEFDSFEAVFCRLVFLLSLGVFLTFRGNFGPTRFFEMFQVR